MSYNISFTISGELTENEVKEITEKVKAANYDYVWRNQDVKIELEKDSHILGSANILDSEEDLSYILNFLKDLSSQYESLKVTLEYKEPFLNKGLPETITKGEFSPSGWKPVLNEMVEFKADVDSLLWDWWQIGDCSDAQALNDLIYLFVENYEEETFITHEPKNTTSIIAYLPKASLEVCKDYIEKYGASKFINGCLSWARYEEEKLKQTFNI